MSIKPDDFTGRWLHDGVRRGQDFSHPSADYEDADESGSNAVKMRHAVVKQGNQDVQVWAPAGWSENEIAEALENNW